MPERHTTSAHCHHVRSVSYLFLQVSQPRTGWPLLCHRSLVNINPRQLLLLKESGYFILFIHLKYLLLYLIVGHLYRFFSSNNLLFYFWMTSMPLLRWTNFPHLVLVSWHHLYHTCSHLIFFLKLSNMLYHWTLWHLSHSLRILKRDVSFSF